MGYNREKEEGFQKIYNELYIDVYRVSLYYTEDEHISEDITQKVFFKLYLHFDNVNMDSIRPYLLRAARNYSFNWLRDNGHGTKHEFFDNIADDEITIHSVEDKYIREEEEENTKKFFAHIMKCLQIENESWYDILHLVYCLGKSHEDAAKELGITVQVLYSKLYRAKQWIRKRFEDEYKQL